MSDPGNGTDPLELLLSGALREQADRVHPAGDGLARIRERVQRRAGWRRVLARPAVRPALAGLAVVGLALAGAVALRQPGGLDTLDSAGGARSKETAATDSATGRAAPPPGPAPSSGTNATGVPGTPVVPPAAGTAAPLPDLATLWPYPSRGTGAAEAEAAVRAGRLPFLRDARQTALRFAQDYLHLGEVDLVLGSEAKDAGIAVSVGRRIGGRPTSVTSVYLVRVGRADDAPYVVVSADATGLTVTAPSAGTRVGPGVPVAGRVVGVDPAVTVSAADAGGPTGDAPAVLEGPAGFRETAAGPENGWTARLDRPPGLRGVVARTASPADGLVWQVTAVPVGPAG